jgi:hypothetical protein
LAILAVAFLTTSSLVQAQDVERITLADPVASFPEPFSRVTGVRELADRSLVIADRLESAVRRIDMRSGTMEDLGRVGNGPGEYQTPGGLLPMLADSTLLIDFGNLRISVVAPDGRIPHSMPMLTAEGSLFMPAGIDAQGRLYYSQGGLRLGPNGVEATTTVPIMRTEWGSEVVDTVAELPIPEPEDTERTFASSGGNFQVRGMRSPYEAAAVWTVTPDGSIALIHPHPYRVEIVDRGSESTMGGTVTYDPVRVTNDDKEAWADRLGGGAAVMVMSGGGGGGGGGSRTMQMPRPDPDDMEWPDVKPAFGTNAARATPDGFIWVQRHVASDAPPLFDVFDSTGTRVRQVELKRGQQLVGFGDGVVYVVNVDDDDLQWLEAYARGDKR